MYDMAAAKQQLLPILLFIIRKRAGWFMYNNILFSSPVCGVNVAWRSGRAATALAPHLLLPSVLARVWFWFTNM